MVIGVDAQEAPSGPAAALDPDPNEFFDALKGVAVEDDGSLRARLWDHAGLADSMLGVSLLDVFDAGPVLGPARGRTPGDKDDPALFVDPARGDSLPDGVRELLKVQGAVGADDVGATISAVGEVFRAINRLESLAAVLLERARVQALRTDALLEGVSDGLCKRSRG